MKIKTFVTRALIAITALSQITMGPVALGAYESSQAITFNGRQTEFQLQLRGKKEKTRYRTEYYQGTCYTTEYDTEYRRECTPVYQTQCSTDYRQECHTEYDRQCTEVPSCRDVNRPVCHTETRQSCTSVPVCRDVPREVCSSAGCTTHMTRECTNEDRCRDISEQVCTDYVTRECTSETQCNDVPRQSCQTVPYEDCRQVQTGEDCQDVPYTVSREVPYSCQQSREVADGTDLVEDILVNAKVTFVGDFAGVTGQDTFVMSVANGVDVGAMPDLQIVSKNDALTHLYQLKKIQETKRRITATESEITAHYQLTVTSAANLVSQFPGAPEIKTMKLTRNSVELGLSARALHAESIVSLKVLKDQRIGGWVTMFNNAVQMNQIQLTENATGQSAVIPFSSIGLEQLRTGRPFQATIKLTGKPALPPLEGVLNARTLERIRDQLAAQSREVTKSVTVRF